ncbi:serine hydrolase domain-containing protein [Streptomyces pseudovenezuelae]|uniref:CubicO group peptidase (Beta-lactamase class C family) n=1 Tax=Streptomyces pseudovenezuelae TaxID=67350 RepID=A0ABT6LXH3_9ACTN|nr:serine hydrolase domain-containing protein [Streptomyces pseudovenezuelae]MDH6220933.1 CubicO group peptidase (beta-lactamase class C family) [Streptomyces pseudovenezuelae]
MSDRSLPTGTPAAQGVDATGVHAFLDALEADPAIEPHSLMIMRRGRLVASGWWAPYTPQRPHLLYSLSKSFTSTAAALAVGEGLLRFDDPVISYFPEFEADITDPRSRAMRVRHVASMASGHEAETLERAMANDRDELVRGFLLVPPERDPGTVFAYNQPATYTLAAIVQRVTGQSLTDYLRSRLLDRIGIGEVAWLRDRAGRELGFSGLHATTDAIARLGQLYLQDGVWEGERLLPEGWVAEATRPHIDNSSGTPEAAQSDWQQGYGYQFWKARHGYRGDGAYGQFCVVLPEHDAVIATTAATEEMQRVLDLAWEHLLPAFGPEPLSGREAADEALGERLALLALPPVPGKSAPPERHRDWSGAEFTPDGGVCADQPKLTGVEVTADADGWGLSLTEDGRRLDLRIGEAGWAVAEGTMPTAVSGGWADADTLAVDVVFLETPHRLAVTCSLPQRTFTAKWRTTPLHSPPLRAMRAPRPSV